LSDIGVATGELFHQQLPAARQLFGVCAGRVSYLRGCFDFGDELDPLALTRSCNSGDQSFRRSSILARARRWRIDPSNSDCLA